MKDLGGAADVVLFRDSNGIDPVVPSTEEAPDNLYTRTPAPNFVSCNEDPWVPKEEKEEEIDHAALKQDAAKMRRLAIQKWVKKKTVDVLDHPIVLIIFTIMTLWALFMEVRA